MISIHVIQNVECQLWVQKTLVWSTFSCVWWGSFLGRTSLLSIHTWAPKRRWKICLQSFMNVSIDSVQASFCFPGGTSWVTCVAGSPQSPSVPTNTHKTCSWYSFRDVTSQSIECPPICPIAQKTPFVIICLGQCQPCWLLVPKVACVWSLILWRTMCGKWQYSQTGRLQLRRPILVLLG